MSARLQKILAAGGFGSRRECESLILEGRVEVDREVITKLGTKVDPEKQAIRVDGEKLKIATKKYFAVNKPRGAISTTKDPSGRLRVVDLVATDQRIYTVGRLDKDSEGLIIVTNDGDLANKLTHPKYGIEKTYLIQVEGHPTREQMESLVSGVHFAEGFVQIKQFQFKRKQKHTTEIEVVLDEGRNREVRRLLAKIGHKVLFLRRVAIGSFVLQDIAPGANRQLTSDEIKRLSRNPYRRKKKTVNRQKRKTGADKPTQKSGSKIAARQTPRQEKRLKSKEKSKESTRNSKKKQGLVARSKKKSASRAKSTTGKPTGKYKSAKKRGGVRGSRKKSR